MNKKELITAIEDYIAELEKKIKILTEEVTNLEYSCISIEGYTIAELIDEFRNRLKYKDFIETLFNELSEIEMFDGLNYRLKTSNLRNYLILYFDEQQHVTNEQLLQQVAYELDIKLKQ
ncbi:MAG: hypothetical protein LBP63_10005 [Prevotellaceae bacterium]|jgi:hypothetical protein|nr:hypothetical protein [Prevotellaceae bacterium]